ncbi:MAG: NAD-dependent epimerase/dehydratase family protein [Ilumatobacteraceae bacterium]
MKIAVTGHAGYLGPALIETLVAAGHDVTGFDTNYFTECLLGDTPPRAIAEVRVDVRDLTAAHFDGFDAVIHYGALSNDPLGNYRPATTHEINGDGAIIARAARDAGVPASCTPPRAASTEPTATIPSTNRPSSFR